MLFRFSVQGWIQGFVCIKVHCMGVRFNDFISFSYIFHEHEIILENSVLRVVGWYF